MRDTTGSTEQELESSEVRLFTLIEKITSGIIVLEKNGIIRFVNPAAERLLDRPANELLNETFGFPLAADEITEIEIISRSGDVRTVAMDLAEIEWGGEAAYLAMLCDVTGHKRAQEALRGSEERYRALFEGSAEGILVADVETKGFTYANPAICTMLGCTEKELKRMSVVDIHPQDALENVISEFQAQARGEKTLASNIPCLRKNGTIIYADINGTKVSIDGRECSVGFFTDITDRRRAEEALRKSENRYRTLLEHLPQKIFLKDKDSIYISCNQNYAQDLKIQPDEIVGKTDYDFHPEELAEKYRADDKRIVESEKTEDIEETYIQDGRDVWVHTVKTPVKDEKGNIIGILGIFWDITAHKRAEDELRKLSAAVIQSPNMIVVTDREGIIEFVNPRFSRVTGYSLPEAIGKPVSMLKSGENDEEFYTNLWQTVKSGKTWIGKVQSRRKCGDTYWEGRTMVPIFNEANRIVNFLLIGDDITDKLRTEQELQRMEKLESVGLLAGGIAHDFNNFLTGILGSISLAKMGVDPSDEIYGTLEQAERAADRACALTHQLLTFSKGGEPVRKGASIEGLIRDSIAFVLSGSNVKPKILLTDNLYSVKVDTGQMSQVLQNLTLNAVQAMPGGGKIEVSAENVTVSEGDRLSLKSGKYVRITIKDQGIGISQEHLNKIYDPYFTTKQSGSGLGLTTAYSIIKKHDGYMTVESEPGIGATFSIYLPACEKASPAGKDAEEQVLTGTGRILVMDDEDLLRDLAGKILGRLGYTVDCARDGTEAVELYRQAYTIGRIYDAVILDLTVPGGMGGKEAIEKLQEIEPSVKAIVCSGYSDDPVMANYWEYGFGGVVAKPYKPNDLGRAVRQLLTADKGNVTG
jgi:PAS domain S-box-containing protein